MCKDIYSEYIYVALKYVLTGNGTGNRYPSVAGLPNLYSVIDG